MQLKILSLYVTFKGMTPKEYYNFFHLIFQSSLQVTEAMGVVLGSAM